MSNSVASSTSKIVKRLRRQSPRHGAAGPAGSHERCRFIMLLNSSHGACLMIVRGWIKREPRSKFGTLDGDEGHGFSCADVFPETQLSTQRHFWSIPTTERACCRVLRKAAKTSLQKGNMTRSGRQHVFPEVNSAHIGTRTVSKYLRALAFPGLGYLGYHGFYCIYIVGSSENAL